ncbi:MAG: D-alanyl-D-alanine carboxypeptidase [Rhodospirillales bacterium RIFCSPLOWO2_12_FULL_58_28]|nr:MAG: D-alanyl-D-alanine carboxypeptidase [Rhodospirillales bacterium RIFCSPLOWO2_02_FULL_58_16]OHC77565.1 MAG: D-alanyl-D-alanine carboxypeptidase [Rhodospirillales bacterium RIFCSPLOWO2_12_FULL_58_28]
MKTLRCLIYFFSMISVSYPAAAIETIAREAILIDHETGTVLFAKDADKPMAPASMSKMMTVYMLFERLRDGRISPDDAFSVSETAWRKGGAKSGSSTMFLDPGKRVRVEDLLRGIIIQSGNDACIVVAEGLAGSEEAFAVEMTRRAREIGMNDSTFKNATGWPDPDHVMTARDLSTLAVRTIKDFPDYFHYYSEKEFTYNGIIQINRNPLLYKEMGVDGMKTGHTEDAGFGLTATAKRGERRLVLVVNGLANKKDRAAEPERLLEWGFREFNNYALFKASETVAEADVWLGESPTVPLIIQKDMVLTMPRAARPGMKVTVNFTNPVPAPIEEGAKIAVLTITATGQEPIEAPLVAGAGVKRLGLFGRLGTALNYIIFGNAG